MRVASCQRRQVYVQQMTVGENRFFMLVLLLFSRPLLLQVRGAVCLSEEEKNIEGQGEEPQAVLMGERTRERERHRSYEKKQGKRGRETFNRRSLPLRRTRVLLEARATAC